MIQRQTLRQPAVVTGTGLFSARPSTLTLRPAPVGTGLVFRRVDLPDAPPIPARAAHLTADPRTPGRNTVLSFDPSRAPGADNPVVATTEHVLSALMGMGVTDVWIDLDGPEVPIGDASALPFVHAIVAAGLEDLKVAVEPIRLNGRVSVSDSRPKPGDVGGVISAFPRESPGLELVYTLEYGPKSSIPRQSARSVIRVDDYATTLAPARTFCLTQEAQQMRAAGFFLHVTPRDVLVIDERGNPLDNTLRFEDELARHKVLDLLGDLALVGRPMQARVVAERSGHALNHGIARAILTHIGQW